MMNIVLLSGGSGKRLWPLSNNIRSKQFIKLFKTEDGEYESMIQRVIRQLTSVVPGANITIATSKSQVSSIKNQIGKGVSICVEPVRRDTFPAIALAAEYLSSVKDLGRDAAVVVCPVDPYVNADYFESLAELSKLAENDEYNLSLMGAEPTYPSEKYGYIIPESGDKYSRVLSFTEKPDEKSAAGYIAKGALWNCGVFAFKIGFLQDIAHRLIEYDGYEEFLLKYESLEKISFDYAVVEKEKNIQVMRFSGQWKDIGTWNTFSEEMSEPAIGNVILGPGCENTNAINELNVPVLCMGIKDAIVAASGDGVLVTSKTQSSYIKPYVEAISQTVMYAEKSWGSFTILDLQKSSMTIKIVLNKGNQLKYHSHEFRDEVWSVVSGIGRTVVDGIVRTVRPGDIIKLPAGCKHTIYAYTDLNVIEVQFGEDISVNDKKKFELKLQ